MDYFKIREFLESRLEGVYQGAVLNQYNTKPLKLEPTPENAEIFNEIYQFLLKTDLNILERSPSGSIRRGPRYLKNLYAYDIKKSSLGVMLTISLDGYLRVIKFGLFKDKDAPDIYPTVAFKQFEETCSKFGVELEDYAIDNGAEIRANTEKAFIDMDPSIIDKELNNVHHLDFHSSYPAGLANTHPEFRPIMVVVWNSEYVNKINKMDVPTIFHKEGLMDDAFTHVLPGKYFGNVKTSGGTLSGSSANLTVRTLVEKDYNTVAPSHPDYVKSLHIFPGDLIPAGQAYEAYEAYDEDSTIIFKMYHKDAVPFMSAFETGTSFFNPKSLTENRYLTWGYNTLENLENYPFITVKAAQA